MHFGQRVCGIYLFLTSRTWKRAALVGLLALALVGFAGAHSASAQVDPQPGVNCLGAGNPGPSMTVQIFNNSTDYTIFPLLSAGTRSPNDEWMEACFRIPANQFPPAPTPSTFYPRASQYRLYVSCCGGGETGIPPGGAVELKLPLYSPLVQTVVPEPAKSGNPTEQFIDWWQGGNINIYAVPTATGGYPGSLAKLWNDDNSASPNRTRTPTRNPPTCGGVNGAAVTCGLHTFTSSTGPLGWEPQQLVEFTLGAAGVDAARKTDNQPLRIWNPENVDYDVSSVNNVYLPSAMLPFGNTLNGTCCAIGYIGTLATIDATFAAIDNWRSSSLGSDWPSYVQLPSTTPPTITPRKVPSPLEIFSIVQDNKGNFNDAWNTTNRFSPAPSTSPQIIRMKSLFEQCFNGQKSEICGPLNDVTALLLANYENYKTAYLQSLNRSSTTWADWGCTLPGVIPLGEPLLLAQLYGWNGFNALSGCNAAANRLEQTPGYKPGDPGYVKGDPRHDYQAAKAQFDQLHYWFHDFRQTNDYGQWQVGEMPNYGQFNPYVGLIHGRGIDPVTKPFMNAPYMYAYSVDDAFGNMQTDGTGLKILVGGPTAREPLPNHVTHEVQFSVGYRTPIAPNNPFAGLIMTNDTYSRCGGAVTQFNPRHEDHPFTTFVVPQGEENATPTTPPPNSVLQCQITMTDSTTRVYRAKVKDFPTKFPHPIPNQTRNDNCGKDPAPCPDPWPNATQITQINQQFVDCAGNASPSDQLDYCKNIYVYQDVDPTNAHLPPIYHVSMGAPPPCNTSPGYNPQPCIDACARQGSSCTK
jgi:hypothetical protein